MNRPRPLRGNSDWVIAGLFFCGALVVAILGAYLFAQRGTQFTPTNGNNPRNYTLFTPSLVPPDPNYPPPAKEQLAFDHFTNVDDISIELSWSTRNVNRVNAIGSHSFTLMIENSKNSTQRIEGAALPKVTVGCVARENPYRSVSVAPMEPFTLNPYEKKLFRFGVDVNCLYLGTADGQYFWRIY